MINRRTPLARSSSTRRANIVIVTAKSTEYTRYTAYPKRTAPSLSVSLGSANDAGSDRLAGHSTAAPSTMRGTSSSKPCASVIQPAPRTGGESTDWLFGTAVMVSSSSVELGSDSLSQG